MPHSTGHLPERKRNRLPATEYGVPGTWALITLATQDRVPVFSNHEFAEATVALLKQQSEHDEIAVLAYCLMPDHVHLLVRIDGDVNAVRFVQAFKGKSTNLSWTFGFRSQLWQRSFHDHVLRPSEDESEHMRYIQANPVRVGIVAEWSDYPFSGSFAYDIEDRL